MLLKFLLVDICNEYLDLVNYKMSSLQYVVKHTCQENANIFKLNCTSSQNKTVDNKSSKLLCAVTLAGFFIHSEKER